MKTNLLSHFLLVFIFSCNTSAHDDAEERIKKATNQLKKQPHDIGQIIIRANAYSEIGYDSLALNDLNKAIKYGSSDSTLFAYALVSRGDIFSDLGKYDEALSDYDRSIEIRPKNEFGYLRRGIFKCKIGDPTACDDLLKAKENGYESKELSECC